MSTLELIASLLFLALMTTIGYYAGRYSMAQDAQRRHLRLIKMLQNGLRNMLRGKLLPDTYTLEKVETCIADLEDLGPYILPQDAIDMALRCAYTSIPKGPP